MIITGWMGGRNGKANKIKLSVAEKWIHYYLRHVRSPASLEQRLGEKGYVAGESRHTNIDTQSVTRHNPAVTVIITAPEVLV